MRCQPSLNVPYTACVCQVDYCITFLAAACARAVAAPLNAAYKQVGVAAGRVPGGRATCNVCGGMCHVWGGMCHVCAGSVL